MKLGVFVDVSNVYYTLQSKYGSTTHLDYNRLLEYIRSVGTISVMKAYATEETVKTEFGRVLSILGFEIIPIAKKVYTRRDGSIESKADADVKIAMDIVSGAVDFDRLVLVSADGDMAPCLTHVHAAGKESLVIGTRISKTLRELATYSVEIPASMTRIK